MASLGMLHGGVSDTAFRQVHSWYQAFSRCCHLWHEEADTLEALKAMYTKVQLHILYDACKAGANSTAVDPKSFTSAAIKAAASVQQPYSATFLLTDNPPVATFLPLLLILNISCTMLRTR